MEKTKKSYFSATRVAVIAMFATLAGLLYVFGFPIAAAFPSWLELNFSDIPALIGTFALGPVSGSIIVLVKILIKLIIKGTSTVFVGELADLLIGIAFVVPSGLIYKKMRTFKGALVAMAVGTLCSTAMSILANWLVLVPFVSSSSTAAGVRSSARCRRCSARSARRRLSIISICGVRCCRSTLCGA